MALPVLIPLLISGGGMVAQYLLAPKVKQEPIEKGKLDDIRLTSSDYGAFIPRGWGKFRIGGNLVWTSGITRTVVTQQGGGGKGMPQQPPTRTYIYTVSLAVFVCRGEIVQFLKIWEDNQIMLGNGNISGGSFEAEDATLAGGAAEVEDETASGDEYVGGLGKGGTAEFDLSSIIPPETPPTNDPDEIVVAYTRVSFFYKSSGDLQAEIETDLTALQTYDFADTADEWSSKTIQIPAHIDSLTFGNTADFAPDLDYIAAEKYWYVGHLEFSRQPDYQVTGVINDSIVYPKDVDDPSEYYNQTPIKDGVTGTYSMNISVPNAAVRFYTGTETQTQDSAIVADLDSRYGTGEGVLRASAHRGIGYHLLENYQLKTGRVPNFTYEVNCGRNDVNDILEDLCADVGLTDTDFSATNGLEVLGFVEHTRTSRRTLVEYLERFFFFRLAEIDGEMKTVLYSNAPISTISADSLRAHEDGEDMPEMDASIVLKEENLLPREIRVSVMNPDLEYRNESVSASLFSSTPATESKEFSFPIIATAHTARTVAEKLLLIEHSETQTVEFEGMPETAKWAVGDVVEVEINGIVETVRIERKQATLPIGKVKFQAVKVRNFTPTIYQDDFTNLAPRRALAAYNFPRNSIVVPIISEPILTEQRGKLGVYLAVCGRGRGISENISLYREFDDENFVLQSVIDTPASVGLGATDLNTHANANVEDTTSVFDLWFFDKVELETVLQADIDRYPTINLLRVGDEWIQFRTATAQTLEENSPYRSKWRVTNLWRGRFGTSSEMSAHGTGEYATLFTSAVKFYTLDSSDIGESITFKAVTGGQMEENGQTSTFTFNPVSAYSISNATADRAFDANNTTINELADVVATVIDDLHL